MGQIEAIVWREDDPESRIAAAREGVWKKMRKSCRWQGFTEADCAKYEDEYNPCAFDACPLLPLLKDKP